MAMVIANLYSANLRETHILWLIVALGRYLHTTNAQMMFTSNSFN